MVGLIAAAAKIMMSLSILCQASLEAWFSYLDYLKDKK